MGKVKSIILTDSERLSLETGFRQGLSHCFRMRCRAVLLKSSGLSSKQVGLQTEMSHVSVNFWVKRFMQEGISARPWAQTYHGLYGRGSCPQSHRTGQAEREQSQGSLAESHGQGSERPDVQAFFISIGARYKEASGLTFKRFYQHWRKI